MRGPTFDFPQPRSCWNGCWTLHLRMASEGQAQRCQHKERGHCPDVQQSFQFRFIESGKQDECLALTVHCPRAPPQVMTDLLAVRFVWVVSAQFEPTRVRHAKRAGRPEFVRGGGTRRAVHTGVRSHKQGCERRRKSWIRARAPGAALIST